MDSNILSLGLIKSISKFHMDVCLPRGRLGRVNIYDISDKYSELLQSAVESGHLEKNITDLQNMFHVGQLVRCFLKNHVSAGTVSTDDARTKSVYEVSLNPRLVNKLVPRKFIRPHTILIGAVESEEDHGFVVDCGLIGVKCFLPKDLSGDLQGLGSLITVCPVVDDPLTFIAAESSRVLKVTASSGSISDYVLDNPGPVHFGCLLPGMCLHAVIHSKISSTLIAKFSDYQLTIARSQYLGSEADYQANNHIVVCLLTVDPGTKQLTGSLLPHLLPRDNCNETPVVASSLAPVGTRLPNCLIKRVDKRSIHLSVPCLDKLNVVIRKDHVPSEISCDNLKSRFAIGQEVSCRVIDHDLLENVAVATMKKKLLRLPFLSISEVKPGDKLTAVVNRLTKTGIVTRVEERLNALIPYLHLADVPLKRPQEKFMVGDKIDCRALVVDTSKSKLMLTAKRGLVESKCPVFGNPDTLELLENNKFKDQMFVAFVVKVSERGLLLAGVGELRAWLPRKETGLGPDDALEATFYRGQVLRIRIVHKLTNKTNESSDRRTKYLVSLRLMRGALSPEKQHISSCHSISIGQVLSAKVHAVRNAGLIVELCAQQAQSSADSTPEMLALGFLAFDHLSDSDMISSLLGHCVKRLQPGSPLNLLGASREVVVVNCSTSTTSAIPITVSAKPTLVRAASNNHLEAVDVEPSKANRLDQCTGFVREFADLRVGSQWFAWVLNHVDYGIFVQFPAGIRGLAPVRLLADVRIPKEVSLVDLFPPGATVIAKVIELAPSEKRRCLVSLRMMDTYFAEEHYVDMAIRSLNSWLLEMQWISHRHEFLAGFRIGDQIDFHVETSDTQSIIGEASKVLICSSAKQPIRVPSIVYLNNAKGVQYVPGQTLSGIVCFVDHSESRVEVVLSTWIIHSVQNRSDDPACTPRLNQTVGSVTVAFRNRLMAVVAFRGHAAGCFGLVPAKRAFNDVVGGNSWTIGQRNKVTLRDTFQQEGKSPLLYLCTLTVHDPVVTSHAGLNLSSLTVGDVAPEQPLGSFIELIPGTLISGLRFNRLSGHVAFFNIPANNQIVFARLINMASNAKEIRAFQNHPPPLGSLMETTAVVLASAKEDKRPGALHSQLPEISFIGKPHVDVGDMVCAQLTRKHHDQWSVYLPGGSRGILHVSGMLHSKHPQPLSLHPNASNQRQHQRDLGNGLKKDRFITCRIVDRIESQSVEPGSSAPIFYVCTKPDVVRGGLKFWEKLKPTFGAQTEGFVKMRSSDGLVISLTHVDDLLVPFTDELQSRIRFAQLRFRIGDHLCVRPLRLILNQLVGELVFIDTPNQTVSALHTGMSCDTLEDATRRLLYVVTEKAQKQRRRAQFLLMNSKTSAPHFIDEPGNTGEQVDFRNKQKRLPVEDSCSPPPKKIKRITLPLDDIHQDFSHKAGLKRKQLHQPNESNLTEVPSPKQTAGNIDTSSWDIANQDVIQRYAAFMLPSSPQSQSNCSENTQFVTRTESTESSHENFISQTDKTASAEWQLMQAETRKALLAALVCEQQTLPKGHLKPTSQEEFELAVRNAPSNAACWTSYMMHVLSQSNENNLSDARAIAERGLRAISASAGLDQGESDLQCARLLSFYLVMEAKALQRCVKQQDELGRSIPEYDPVLAVNTQANRLSDVLARLVDLDQVPFIRRAIDTLTDIGQFDRAEDLAKRLIKAAPVDPDRWISLVKVRFRAGRVAAAREAQRNGSNIIRAANCLRFLLTCARLEFEFGDPDRAITGFRQQLANHPRQRSVYEEFIKLLLHAGKRNEAESVRDQARIVLKPNDLRHVDSLFEQNSI